jgi:hypothetical protein
VLARARERGFEVVDTVDLVEAYRRDAGSLVAGMALYVDHGHFSREGMRRLAEAIPAPPAPPIGAPSSPGPAGRRSPGGP